MSQINEAGKDLHPYVLPSSWKCSLDGLTNETASLRYLVRGPKRSGKSTFGRTLVNNLLRKYVIPRLRSRPMHVLINKIDTRVWHIWNVTLASRSSHLEVWSP